MDTMHKLNILISGGNGNIANIIKNNLSELFSITAPSRSELDFLNYSSLEKFLENNKFDVFIHTAVVGGRRIKDETSDVVYNNLLIFENILKFVNKFKMIINLDSGAIYDRSTDIYNRKEDELVTIPRDYYGFSKYIIHERSLNFDNIYNLRIFNLFHCNEESDRFIKSCFLAKQNNTNITIYEDKYFDFFYELDFITILIFYLNNINTLEKLKKTVNLCYKDKYKLSDVAKIITTQHNINKSISIGYQKININTCNYCGDNTLVENYKLELLDLHKSLIDYEHKMIIKK
jgi:dTDP-4-dehydrorhamnose reductase